MSLNTEKFRSSYLRKSYGEKSVLLPYKYDFKGPPREWWAWFPVQTWDGEWQVFVPMIRMRISSPYHNKDKWLYLRYEEFKYLLEEKNEES